MGRSNSIAMVEAITLSLREVRMMEFLVSTICVVGRVCIQHRSIGEPSIQST